MRRLNCDAFLNNIAGWIEWFFDALDKASRNSLIILDMVLKKTNENQPHQSRARLQIVLCSRSDGTLRKAFLEVIMFR